MHQTEGTIGAIVENTWHTLIVLFVWIVLIDIFYNKLFVILGIK